MTLLREEASCPRAEKKGAPAWPPSSMPSPCPCATSELMGRYSLHPAAKPLPIQDPSQCLQVCWGRPFLLAGVCR